MGPSLMYEDDLLNQISILWTLWLAHRYCDLTGMWLKWKAEHNKLYEYYYSDICDFHGDNGDTEVVPATIVDE